MLGNFLCRGVLLIWIIVGQGPTVLSVGAGEIVVFLIRWPVICLCFLSLGDGLL